MKTYTYISFIIIICVVFFSGMVGSLHDAVAQQICSQLFGCNGENWATNSVRLLDFSGAGYQGGQTPPRPAVTRTISASLGDGVQDATQAFKNAIAAGGTIYIPAGTYKITDRLIISKSNIILRGAGQEATILYFPFSLTDLLGPSQNSAGHSIYSFGGALIELKFDLQGVGIEDLTIEFPETTARPHHQELGYNAIEMRADNCWIRNVTTLNTDIGINFIGSHFCTVEHVTVSGTGSRVNNGGHHGIRVHWSNNNLFTNFYIGSQFIHDITVQSINDYGNVFKNGSGININFDHHGSNPHDNLFSNINVGQGSRVFHSSGADDGSPHSGPRETFWNIRKSDGSSAIGSIIKMPYKNTIAPQANGIGATVTSIPSNPSSTSQWLENIPPSQLCPQDLHAAMVALKNGQSLGCGAPDTTPPSTPANLSATAISGTQINLSWSSSTDNVGVTAYRLERCTGSSCSNFSQIATPTGTSYNDIGLSANTTYRYRVRAVDAAGNLSVYSSIASVATKQSLTCTTVGSNAFYGCYYDNDNQTNLVLTRTDNAINFAWGNGSPDSSVGPDSFSVKWEGDFTFNAAPYLFTATTDDGMQVVVDGELIINEWRNQPSTTYTSTKTLTAGTHRVSVYYYESTGNATAKFSWQEQSQGDTTPPTVSLTQPTAGTLVANTTTFSATASDNVGVTKVEFFVDNILKATDTSSPYSFSWDTTNGGTHLCNGPHTHALTTKAYDAAGNTKTSSAVSVNMNNPSYCTVADTTPPTVSFTAPTSGSTVSGTSVTVSVTASDNVGVAGVQFFLDGVILGNEDTSSPYSVIWNTTSVTNGSHSITAKARDTSGNIKTSNAITVSVNNIVTPPPVPPSVQPCHLLTTAQDYNPLPQKLVWLSSFVGKAYDVTNNNLFVTVDCIPSAAPIVTFTGSGSQFQILFNEGYMLKENGTSWEKVVFSGTFFTNSSVWLDIGNAKTASQTLNTLSQSDLSNTTALLFYICTWNSTQWKCGCADNACVAPKWQLQGIWRPE
jgi:hypothetical protein